MAKLVKYGSIILLVILITIASTACGKELPEDSGWRTLGSNNSSDADSESIETTPSADEVVPVEEPVSIEETLDPKEVAPVEEPAAIPTPIPPPPPNYSVTYRDDVVAAVTRYWDAWNAHDQAGINRALTNSSIETGRETIEEYQAAASMGRGWPDYPHITIKEVTHIRCYEALCKLSYIIHSVPPDIGESTFPPFDANSYSWVRLVDGVWLNDKTSETYRDGFNSTHRD